MNNVQKQDIKWFMDNENLYKKIVMDSYKSDMLTFKQFKSIINNICNKYKLNFKNIMQHIIRYIDMGQLPRDSYNGLYHTNKFLNIFNRMYDFDISDTKYNELINYRMCKHLPKHIRFSDLTERLNRINFSENIKEISYKKFSDIINGDNYKVSKRDGLPEKYDEDNSLTYLAINNKCICAIRISTDNVRILHIESLEKGLGRKMLQYIIDTYSNDHEITLHVDGDERLVKYYESLGFKLIDTNNEMKYDKF